MATEITKSADSSAKSFKTAFRDYRAEMWRQRKYSIAGLLLPGIGNILVMYIPTLVISRLIRDYHGRIPTNWADIVPYIGFMAGAWLLGEVLWRCAFLMLNRTDSFGMQHLYSVALNKLLDKDIAFFNNNFAGSLTKKAIGYARGFEGFVDTLAFNIVGNLIPLVFAIYTLWTIAPVLVLVLVSMLVLTFTTILPNVRKRQKLVALREAASNKMAGHVADVIGNMSAVQAFGHERFEQAQHDVLVKDYTDKSRRSWDYHVIGVDTIVAPFSVITNILGLVLAILVSHDAQTIAAVFVTFNYFAQSSRVLFEFNRIYRNIENALTEAAEFTALVSAPAQLKPAPDTSLQVNKGQVDFNAVNFAYNDQGADNDELLFKGLDLHIKAGEKVALVGHSGSGKTTITKLLLRFVDIDGGTLQIDGQDISQVSLQSLRQSIAYVPQEPAMFHRSLYDNIRYGRLEASADDIRLAAQQANASEFIETLPEGFDTMVGERGVKLSGGQRQRIAIARAMLKNAPILVLDEATSALDSESEVLIQDALWKLMEGRTAIVIAHRLSTIQKMDRIIVLDKGTIVEQGSHKQLISQQGTYAKLWAHQSGGFIEE